MGLLNADAHPVLHLTYLEMAKAVYTAYGFMLKSFLGLVSKQMTTPLKNNFQSYKIKSSTANYVWIRHKLREQHLQIIGNVNTSPI